MYARGPRLRTILCLFLLFVLICSLPELSKAAPWWSQSINVESKVGTDRSIQSLDVMYPIAHTNDSLTFTDLRGRIDDDQSVELNLGLAHRSVIEDPLGFTDEAVLGYYGFADRLESQFDNTFYQATAGAEYFTKDYSLRVNGYLPEDDRKPSVITPGVRTTGTQIFIEERRNYERPLPGYDLELGRTIRFDGWELYGRGSYFRFHHSDVAEVEGTRFRAGLQFDGSHQDVNLPEETELTLGVEWQEDSVREEQTFGVVRFRVPFGTGIEDRRSNIEKKPSAVSDQPSAITASRENKSSPSMGEESDGGEQDSRLQTQDSGLRSWQQDRLTERIERDVDMVTGRSETTTLEDTEPAVLAANGRTLDRLVVAGPDAGSSGPATLADPVGLSTALDTATSGGAVFARAGTYSTTGETLAGGQALIGAGSSIVLRTPEDDHRVNYRLTDDARPTINGTTQNPTVQLDTGTTGQVLSGLKLTGDGHVVKSNRNADVTLDNLVITATGIEDNDGVHLDKPEGEWLLSNLTLTSVPSLSPNSKTAINVDGGSADVAVRGTEISFTDPWESGIDVNELNGELTIRNTDVTANGTGLYVNEVTDVTLENLRVTSQERLAINLANTASVQGDSITVRGVSGLQIFNSDGVTIDGYRALAVGDNGLNIDISENVSVTNFEIVGPANKAISVDPSSGSANENLTFEGTVTNAGDTVLSLEGTSDVTYRNLTGTITHDGSAGSTCTLGDVDLEDVDLTFRNTQTGITTRLSDRSCE